MANPNYGNAYNGNSNLKRAGAPLHLTQEQLNEWFKCAKDPIYFAEKYIQIVHIDHGLIPIKLFDFQKDIIHSISNGRQTAVVTSRQAGKTTTAVCIILHYILFNKSKQVGLLANKGDSAREILERIQIAYEALPKWLQSGIKEWNKGSVILENGCKVIATATSGSAARGKSFSFLYIDECLEESTKVCLEILGSYYYSSMSSFINIDERHFIEVEDPDMIYTVYKTTNKINGKEYIGFHKVPSINDINPDLRSESGSVFWDGYLGSGKILRNALEKYKPENFKQEILFITNNSEYAFEMERHLVNEDWVNSNSTLGGKNCILIGENNGFYGKKHHPETLKKIQEKRSKTLKERPFSWCEGYFTKTMKKFVSYKEIYDYLNIEDDVHQIHKLAHDGEIKFNSDFLHKVAVSRYLERKNFLETADERREKKSQIASARFKGVPKTEESNLARLLGKL